MKTLLRFECIGDGAPYNPTLHRLGIKGPSRYYVKELFLGNGNVVSTKNMHHMKDFSRANGCGTRGVYAEYLLEDGHYYSVKQPLSWTKFLEYYCTVINGNIVELTREEVWNCLKAI